MSKGADLEQALAPVFERWVRDRDLTARTELIEAFLFLPAYIAGQYTGKGLEYDDLYQTGCHGLIRAVDRYRPAAGSFSGYAYGTILGEIKHAFRDDGLIRQRHGDFTAVLPLPKVAEMGDVDEGIAGIETRDALLTTLDEMPDMEREVVLMLLGGRSQRAAADSFGISQMSVSRLYKKFRAKVRAELYEL